MEKKRKIKMLALSTKRDVEKAFRKLLEEAKGEYCSLELHLTGWSDGSLHASYQAYLPTNLGNGRTPMEAVDALIIRRNNVNLTTA